MHRTIAGLCMIAYAHAKCTPTPNNFWTNTLLLNENWAAYAYVSANIAGEVAHDSIKSIEYDMERCGDMSFIMCPSVEPMAPLPVNPTDEGVQNAETPPRTQHGRTVRIRSRAAVRAGDQRIRDPRRG